MYYYHISAHGATVLRPDGIRPPGSNIKHHRTLICLLSRHHHTCCLLCLRRSQKRRNLFFSRVKSFSSLVPSIHIQMECCILSTPFDGRSRRSAESRIESCLLAHCWRLKTLASSCGYAWNLQMSPISTVSSKRSS